MIELTRSWLYVPAHKTELLAKAMAGAADAVVLDLEDAVPADAKDVARDNAVAALGIRHPKPVWVRINALESPWGKADLAAFAGTDAGGLRLPKAEEPDLVRMAADDTGLPVHAIIESALGVENAFRLATAHPLVAVLSLGEADLMADLRVRDRAALDWVRQRVVNGSRAAGLPSPPLAAWTDVADLAGLAEDTAAAKTRGFFGRSVLHPKQIDVVNRLFTPDADEVADARTRLERSRHRRDAAWMDDQGRFVDPALIANARWLVELADALKQRGSAK
ncbi:HpcH/HpaI aldolase/citrate lyase family protein [Saccharopolyspora phatthalungensis]|uniref:Citrate lyase subunit beta/citryl-CoA lyase n=1 Tax=Saccharopolyspora phatthalungensis TaxID=664693 RepID=A0A840QFB7_9PSEU|nr:CoA ester lyase [Saccharopolyspora phatthalungensis]MBB5158751.1 citrate lyase subunit beta/citryl-CoA lyase [Saccharopolyspora phatthalungensis]